ncbi:MAG: hypothetical protein DRQ48_01390 [Gammaproteobacteria bacterium]|nr:MAG: hypothetical protein DRQ58_01020 [Gammaproteobacteria bacterium]RKZ72099.1 MAG: hypothetical protein DRQ48_01390 [Gammaproteobacteria bacterium]
MPVSKTIKPKSNTTSYSQKEVDRAWDHFLGSDGDKDNLTVRNLIADSWQRSLSHGVNPEQQSAPLFASEGSLHTLRTRNNDLMNCARPVLEQANSLLRGMETVLFLTDYQGLNLKVVGDDKTLDDAHAIGLTPGSGWKEVMTGSNAVGTTIATGNTTQVHGEEHFIQAFKPWTCTASVITDPYDNQMIGIIDISGLRKIFDKYHIPLVVAWAGQIQTSLANNTLEQWNEIQENCSDHHGNYRNSGNLLFDKQGRLINYSQNVTSVLNSLGIDYDPSSKCRISMEQFGGEEIIYPHDAGLWISGDWVEPVKDGNDILGFQLHVPAHKNVSHLYPDRAALPNKLKSNTDPFSKIYGKSDSFKASANKARQAASTPLPILIQGQTGIGKDLFARAIHDSSNYSDGPLIDLNCGAFTRDILNSELFGYVEGAFTGAKKGGMQGKIEAANGGTLFLDEIGEMPIEIQPVFLRVLQERVIYRVGAIKPIQVDFRLISATNLELKRLVAENRFRKDLYFRLSTITISLDPLSGRHEDIEGIAQLVLERTRKAHTIVPKYISPSLLTTLKNREWPGNIRELVNVVECMCFMSDNETLSIEDLPDEYLRDESGMTSESHLNLSTQPAASLDSAERQTIEAGIKQTNGNMTQAAKLLGIAKGTLYRKVKKHGIKKAGEF